MEALASQLSVRFSANFYYNFGEKFKISVNFADLIFQLSGFKKNVLRRQVNPISTLLGPVYTMPGEFET